MRARLWARSGLRCLFRRFVLLPILIALCIGSSCSPSETDAPVFRFIDEEPTEEFTSVGHLEPVPGFRWTFESREDLAPWRGANLDLDRAFDGDRLLVHFPASSDPSRRPGLVRQVDLESDSVDVISVQLRGSLSECAGGGQVRFLWAASDGRFSEERSLSAQAVRDGGFSTGTARFPVGEHPHWEGLVPSIRIVPTFLPDCTLEVVAVHGEKFRFDEERLAAAAGQPRKVTLDHEVRNALLAPPGHTITRQVDVPRDGVFSFSYGVANGVTEPVEFQVFLAEGGSRERLFHASLHPDSLYADQGWQDAEVDLSRFAGKRVTFELETSSGESFDRARTSPAWGNPEVWRRTMDVGRPNVILVSLDTLRADHLSLYGYGRDTSPNIDRWAERSGVTFENVVAPSPWTLPSHASLFTGLNALHHGVNHGYPVPPALTMMAERFRLTSYSTMAITGGGWVSPAFGFDQGFDRFRTWGMDFAGERELATGIDWAIRWMSSPGRRPFFLFIHTFEIHAPFRARQPFFANLDGSSDPKPESFQLLPGGPVAEDGFVVRHVLARAGQSDAPRGPLSETDRALVSDLYDSGIAYADAQLDRLFRALNDLGLRDNTVVVLTSDHGEALGERQLVGHTHLYDFNLMVPLVFILPDGRYAGRRVSEQVSLVDVLPTLLDFVGIAPSPGLDGSSLVPLLEGEAQGRREAWSYAAATNVGISLRVSNRLKYIYNNTVWPPHRGNEELYHLDVDPKEETNLAASAAEAAKLRGLVQHKLGTRTNGLRIHFKNAGGGPFSGSVRAPFLRPVRAKAFALPCSCLSWEPGGDILFDVPPGEAFNLSLEGIGEGALELEASGDELHDGLEWSAEPSAIDQPKGFAFDGSSWREVDLASERPPSTGVIVRWQGDGTVRPRDERDEELVQQLEALGYVND